MATITIQGCSSTVITKNYLLDFSINSSPYVLHEAKNGKFEQVCIKRVNMVEEGIF